MALVPLEKEKSVDTMEHSLGHSSVVLRSSCRFEFGENRESKLACICDLI